MDVMIGVDPHKRSDTATMLDRSDVSWHGSWCGLDVSVMARSVGLVGCATARWFHTPGGPFRVTAVR
jgi:hypothetical protein